MYVAVKGGEKAIAQAHRLQADLRRGDRQRPAVGCDQIADQLSLAVDRVMTEGGICDAELAALAIKQASGDLVEAIFLLRAYRTTLPRLADSLPLATQNMRPERRVSAVWKDLPGGQVLGPTSDYSHRLLDFTLLANGEVPAAQQAEAPLEAHCPPMFDLLVSEGLAAREQDDGSEPVDITREPPSFPTPRSARLQQLMRADEGWLLALGYSTQRGYGRTHPFAGEIRTGMLTLAICPEELGFTIDIGEILLTECEMVNGFTAPDTAAPHFTRGYGLAFGRAERKTMAMALVDRALQSREHHERITSPAQDEEFVLAHADNVEAAGFVSHLKLPHYVDFQAELALLKQLQQAWQEQQHG
ncbi:carbon-phosphorus lyase complex subunit PhnI [Duffyella gerundensis]|uniref:carbon-phosphorus lyase complex subunit PhnI n=1 Tax=Duffyella gerundensis TaxID=1619313 RepID=UPI0021F76C89|nr:carbon-phosphorus lyase complex subunit PhnI [Duffyella gerundensis]